MSSASVATSPHSTSSMMHVASSATHLQNVHYRSSGYLAPASSPTSRPDVIANVSSQNVSVPGAHPLLGPSSSVILPKKDVPLVQPKKDWVLPARAKPGRKPSMTEPVTKRKAQNRASQRAFRERKQSYLQELEEKVAAYEAAEIDRSVDFQKMAQKLSLENEGLRKELATWKDKAIRLEGFVKQMQMHTKAPIASSGTQAGAGCRAPSHERPATRKGALAKPGTKGKEKGGVRFADSVSADTSAVAVPIQIKRNTSSVSTASATSGSLAPAKKALWPIISDETVRASSVSARSSIGRIKMEPSESPGSPPSPLLSFQQIPLDGGCGFCTEASPCVCAGDVFDLTNTPEPAKALSSPERAAEKITAALPLSERALGTENCENRMSIDSLTAGRDASQRSAKLLTLSSHTNEFRLRCSAHASKANRHGVKRLWYTVEKESSQPTPAEATCTGDPTNCSACSSDPSLAAFCEAVTTASSSAPSSIATHFTDEDQTEFVKQVAPVQPPHIVLARPTLGPSSRTSSYGESIPSAWHQIRSHPRFSQWQGGLNLLAEVVSKRSGSVHSPLLANNLASPATLHDAVSIVPTKHARSQSLTSSDRATAVAESNALALSSKRDRTSDNEVNLDTSNKRRRTLIDKEAVQAALAMLDAGTIAHPRHTYRSPQETKDTPESLPCPCPWRPADHCTG